MITFSENFFVYGNVGTQLAAANSTFNTGWIIHGDRPAIISAGFTDNTKTLTLSRTSTQIGNVERRVSFAGKDTIVIGFAFRATQRGSIFRVNSDESTTLINLEWPNGFKIGDVTAPGTIFLNKVYYAQMQITKSTKEVVLRMNGMATDYIKTTLTDDIPEDLQLFWGYDAPGTNADFAFGDVVFNDSEILKPSRVVNRAITSADGTGWDPVPNSKTRLEIMQNLPPVVTQYTESDTVNSKDLYSSNAEIADDAEIQAVSVVTLLAKTDIGDQYVAVTVSDGTTDKLGADVQVPIQPTYIQGIFETDVAGAAWTKATAEAVSVGPTFRPRP